jgi:hypothetical protein
MNRTKLKFAVIVLIFLSGILLPADAWSQGCAMCKVVAEQGGDAAEETRAGGLNTGIIYLMIIPYIILFFIFRKRIFRFFKEMRDIYN